MPLTLLDIIPSLVSVGVIVVARHNTLRDVLAERCHRAHLGVQVEAGNDLTADHSHTHPADLRGGVMAGSAALVSQALNQ